MTTTSQAEINNTNTFTTSASGGGGGGGATANNNSNDIGTMQNPNVSNKTKINSSNQNGNNQANTSGVDTGKRKKLKSRTFTLPNANYTKDHLDAWLEACLKDASSVQLSSSSEFLDYNPSRKSPPQQQQHQQQQQMNNTNQTSQQFALRSNNNQQPSPYAGPMPFSQGFQRGVPNFMKPSRYSLMFPSSGNYFNQHDGGAQDFASLPPLVNLMGGSGSGSATGSGVGGVNIAMGAGGSSELENNSTDVLDGSASNPNMSRGFRFSDPCLLNPSDNDSKVSGQNTPDRRNNTSGMDGMDNQKFFTALMEQINLLHETNTKICRNLHETKVDIEALKHAPTWGMRHRRDSLSGLSTHSQPMVFGGGFGTQSPAPTYHSGAAYAPGMMTDVVREVKEAARVREDALLNRVKAMVEERQWTMNESNLRMLRDIEELKAQIHHFRNDRKETNKRINHLEAENKYMRQMIATLFNNRNISDIIYENEALRPRKSYAHAGQGRRSHSLNLHYGTVHHQPVATATSLDDHEEAAMAMRESTSLASTTDIETMSQRRSSLTNARNSFSSCDEQQTMPNGGGANVSRDSDKIQPLMSPPSFSLVSPVSEAKRNSLGKIDKPKGDPESGESSKELQRELHEAVAARREADQRIIALEKVVNNLRLNSRTAPTSHASSTTAFITNGDGCNSNAGDGAKAIKQLPQRSSSNSTSTKLFTNVTSSPSTITSHHPHMWHISAKPQHHDQQQQPPQQLHSPITSGVTMMPKLSVSGPITDL